MISLKEYNSKSRLPECDYTFSSVVDFKKVLVNLSPKLEGTYEILIVNPTIKEVKSFVDDKTTPNWLNVTVFMQTKKLEEVCMEFPELQPKKQSTQDIVNDMVAQLTHMIDKPAIRTLKQAYRGNLDELREVLTTLDKECTQDKITLKQVQQHVIYTKPVYASQVVDAFLMHEKQRWSLFTKLRATLGDDYAYNAIYKYIKTLLVEKNTYLQNKDIHNRIVKHVDAPTICYAYTIFSMNTNSKQLYALMCSLDTRCASCLERIENVNLQ